MNQEPFQATVHHRTRKAAFGTIVFIFTLAIVFGIGSWILAD